MAIIRPNSEVRLIKNVPFYNNYRDVINFDNKINQENYFKSLPNVSLTNFKYVRNNGAIKVPYYRDEILDYNYMMFKNKAYGDKYFYAFITNISYINPNTSLVEFELDIWQSWYFDITFKESYIEREHCTRWNSDGSPVINTIPENLDFGSEYRVTGQKRLYDLGAKAQIKWLVIGLTLKWQNFSNLYRDQFSNLTAQEKQNYFDSSRGFGVPTNLFYIVVPINEYGSSYTDVKDNTFSINGVEYTNAYDIIYHFTHAVGLTETIKTLFVTDFLPISYNVTSASGGNIQVSSSQIRDVLITTKETSSEFEFFNSISVPMIVNASNNDERAVIHSFTFADKYSALKQGITESKLLMYPYSFNQLMDLQGDNFIIKNEYVDGTNINIDIRSAINISNKVAYTVSNYLGMGSRRGMLYLDNGIINSNDNRLSVVDSYTSAYIQGNMNSLQTSVLNTQLQSKANMNIAINSAYGNTLLTSNTMNKNTGSAWLNGIWGMVGGAYEGAVKNMNSYGGASLLGMGKGVTGLVSGIENSALNNMVAESNTIIENNINRQNTSMQGEASNQIAINNVNAKIQDAKAVPDNVSLQGGDVAFNYGYENLGVKIISKQITQEYIDILQDYFRKYGYAVHRFKVPNIATRRNWNYIKTIGARITGNIPDMFLQGIENILNSGVTIWHTTEVGNFSLNNDEV